MTINRSLIYTEIQNNSKELYEMYLKCVYILVLRRIERHRSVAKGVLTDAAHESQEQSLSIRSSYALILKQKII